MEQSYDLYLDTDHNETTGLTSHGWSNGGVDYLLQGAMLHAYTGNGTNWSWSYIGNAVISENSSAKELSVTLAQIGKNEPSNLRIGISIDGNPLPLEEEDMAEAVVLITGFIENITPPAIISGEVSGKIITLTFDVMLDSSYVPSISDFTINKNNITFAAVSIIIEDQKVLLNLEDVVSGSDEIFVSYNPFADENALRDTEGNLVQAFSLLEVPKSYVAENPWSNISNLPKTLMDHGQSTLNDGRIMITGGRTLTNTCYIYTPSSNTWSAVANMPISLYGHGQSTLGDGRILVTGGTGTGGASSSSCYIYNPTSNTWSAVASLPVAMTNHTQSTLMDGRVLIISESSSGYIYNPSTNTWITSPNIIDDFHYATQTTLKDGRVLVVGGMGSGNISSYIYNPSNSVWTRSADLPSGIYHHSASLLKNGKVMLTGGVDNSGILQNKTFIYDPSSNTWATGASITQTLWYQNQSTLPDGRVVVTGGRNNTTSSDQCFIFNDNTFDSLNNVTISSITYNSLSITVSANDISSLDYSPYIFNRNGVNITTWTSISILLDSNLSPNTSYTYRFKARDSLGNISNYSTPVSIYTLAENPSNIEIMGVSNTSVRVNIINNTLNGQTPEYQLELKLKGAGESGINSSISTWSTVSQITFTGLTQNTEYELWVTTRNHNGVTNQKYLAVNSIKTNNCPSITNNTIDNQIISSEDGYKNLSVSGFVQDENLGDIINMYYCVDNLTSESGISFGDPIYSSGLVQPYTGSLDLSTQAEGVHNIYLWAQDSQGEKSSILSSTFVIDKHIDSVLIPTLSAISSSAIRILPYAFDTSGLNELPYIYNRDGLDINVWSNNLPYIDLGLLANKQYSYSYKARDKVGNISNYTTPVSIYTLALNPLAVTQELRTPTTVTVQILTNPDNFEQPKYLLELKNKGSNADDYNVTSSSWSVNSDVTLSGLYSNTDYDLWITTSNGDNITNSKYLVLQIPKMNNGLQITGTAINGYVFSNHPNYNNLVLSGTITGSNVGDLLNIKYKIDNEAEGQLGISIVGDGSEQIFDRSIDLSNYSNGNHLLKTWIESNSGDRSETIEYNFIMDKNAPINNLLQVSAESESSISITSSALDDNGMDIDPYLFNVDGLDMGSWTNLNHITISELLPNKYYTFMFKSKDNVGNITDYSTPVGIYTLALNPESVAITRRDSTNIDVQINSNQLNSNMPEYMVELKLNGAGGLGENQGSTNWSTNTAISFLGVSVSEDYDLWITVRNGDLTNNSKYLAAQLLKSNTSPILDNVVLSSNTISEKIGFNKINLTGTIRDEDLGNNIKLFYSLDEVNGDGTLIGDEIVANGENQPFNIELDLSSNQEGSHDLYIWAEDNSLGKSTVINKEIYIDKSISNISSLICRAISTSAINIIADASDESGLAEKPFLFNINGIDLGSWTSSASIDIENLNPNTRYIVKYKVKDSLDNESMYSTPASIFTLAINPEVLSWQRSTNSTLDINLLENEMNDENPEYKLELKLKGSGINGNNLEVSDWSSNTAIRMNGLNYLSEYEVWLTTRNSDNVENLKYLAIESVLSNNLIPILNDSSEENQIISNIPSYSAIKLTGTLLGANEGDVLNFYYRVDGLIGDSGIGVGDTIISTQLPQNYEHNLNLSNLSEGNHILYFWLEDEGGGKSTEYSINFAIDKSVDSAPTITKDNNSIVTIESGIDSISGIQKTMYKLEGGTVQDWTIYTTPFSISNNQSTKVYAKSIDMVGNESKTTLTTFFDSIQIKQGNDVYIALKANNIANFSNSTFKVYYNTQALTLTDLSAFTNTNETITGLIKGTDIEVINYSPGNIIFKKSRILEAGEKWSGVVNILKFRANTTGGTTISFTIE